MKQKIKTMPLTMSEWLHVSFPHEIGLPWMHSIRRSADFPIRSQTIMNLFYRRLKPTLDKCYHWWFLGCTAYADKSVPCVQRVKVKVKLTGLPPRRPGFKSGSGHMGFCDGQKWRWGSFSPRTSISPANLHSICFSTIISTITRGWYNRPGVAAVPIAS
jgi:hypothetical protein